jgi:hypothetical protein
MGVTVMKGEAWVLLDWEILKQVQDDIVSNGGYMLQASVLTL